MVSAADLRARTGSLVLRALASRDGLLRAAAVYDDQFDARRADDRLRAYRRNGPNGWTTRLVAGSGDGRRRRAHGARYRGRRRRRSPRAARSRGGVAVDVDASGPYIAASRTEAERRGLADRVTYVKGDAVARATDLAEADLVALDRVVCCYPHMEALVRVAARPDAPAPGDGPAARRRLDPGRGRRQQSLERPAREPVPGPRPPDSRRARGRDRRRPGSRREPPGPLLADDDPGASGVGLRHQDRVRLVPV